MNDDERFLIQTLNNSYFVQKEGEMIKIFDLEMNQKCVFWKEVRFSVGEETIEGDEVLVGKGLKKEDIDEFVSKCNKGVKEEEVKGFEIKIDQKCGLLKELLLDDPWILSWQENSFTLNPLFEDFYERYQYIAINLRESGHETLRKGMSLLTGEEEGEELEERARARKEGVLEMMSFSR